MKTALTEQEAKTILKILEDVVAPGPWERSNFLRIIRKNLIQANERFANQIAAAYGSEKAMAESHLANRIALRTGQQEVFIALYSSNGSDMQTWERIVINLPRQLVSRPIYTDEEHVNYFVKSKENRINQAYVAIYINQSDILPTPSDKRPIDRFGKPLISLKDKTLNLSNISRFVHSSGVYHYVKGRLIKNTRELEK